MAAINYQTALNFVWQPGFDDPRDGYHVTPGDAGGGTKGGVIEATWAAAVAKGLVTGTLADATNDQLAAVLRYDCWGTACDTLRAGVDLMLFNGRMMSGGYPRIFQKCLGVYVDGDIGPITLAVAAKANPASLVEALTTAHLAYLSQLSSWPEFKNGWTHRCEAAQTAAIALIAHK
ncbi:MAG TPA: putative peptidoglycan-binding domain-containing protein [Acetobacteraceae bacterium]|jgi:lysozyme family protein|nr:putative peptidoglycan-binding domain-containing protein [Acetobacteraceae bacterium]